VERLKGLLVAAIVAVAVSVVAAGPAAAAKGGNNDTAKACQHGGWKTLVPRAGGTFANQGDCVNDGAQGSAPFAGQAACAQAGGTFVVGGFGHTLWQCNDYSPSADDSLAAACIEHDGGLSFESEGNITNTEHSGRCVPK
jgi:hypothetical protein